jgi:general stress protein 26
LPRRVRPRSPKAWNVPHDPRLWVTLVQANRRLAEEEVYWVLTSTRDGKPHPAPVWGIWKDLRLFFETDPNSMKGRNLRANPQIMAHLQDRVDTVMVEGTARRLSKTKESKLLQNDYSKKYDYEPDLTDETKQGVFEVTSDVAHAWRVPKMHRSLVNFVF